ncbi:bifunctional DNA primase/polymerase [Streptomyces sp. ISL-36]|uniref:bifunctional DNA primase/polymerase n=1 Tax=Streptomyces sp. ISL-36 TaxID=2819182 RepID=UPI001BEA2749|nr:bifunctional DNA primase/polymerase [Streptomyces sp. ISL-36]MBT2440053.1 bifunctional DNA primase/polymerase [Streptomyces sp. ISL-36]
MAISARRSATLALAHALSAAERGLPVIPLSANKLPALRSPHRAQPAPTRCRGECGLPGHGVHDATTDPAAVRALFAAAPWATGYGIACGRPSHHLIGVDLDVKPSPTDTGTVAPTDSTAELRHLALEHLFTLPPTVTVLTPSGGRHLWLTGPPDVVVPNSASRLAPGIDIRGAGGYLVGPGSVTARGAYRLAPDTAHLAPAPCPRALLDLIAPPAPPPRAHHPGHADPRRGQGLIHFVLTAHEGQRNTRLFWAACRAYESGLGDCLTEALTTAAVRTGLPEHEARATIDSAARLTPHRMTGPTSGQPPEQPRN